MIKNLGGWWPWVTSRLQARNSSILFLWSFMVIHIRSSGRKWLCSRRGACLNYVLNRKTEEQYWTMNQWNNLNGVMGCVYLWGKPYSASGPHPDPVMMKGLQLLLQQFKMAGHTSLVRDQLPAGLFWTHCLELDTTHQDARLTLFLFHTSVYDFRAWIECIFGSAAAQHSP